MSNLAIWDRLGKTDPRYTKSFTRAGGFKGTSVKPVYTLKKLTEEFGPVGQGWGTAEPKFQTIQAADELLVFCTVELWWQDRKNVVYGVGGDKVIAATSNGLRASDEAFKMAFTDALSNALKHLGMSADVHLGLFEDAGYVAAVRQDLSAPKAQPAPSSTASTRTADQHIADFIGAAEAAIKAWRSIEESEAWKADHAADLAMLKQQAPQAWSDLKQLAREAAAKLPQRRAA